MQTVQKLICVTKARLSYLWDLEQTLAPFAAKVPSHSFGNARRIKLAAQVQIHKNEISISSFRNSCLNWRSYQVNSIAQFLKLSRYWFPIFSNFNINDQPTWHHEEEELQTSVQPISDKSEPHFLKKNFSQQAVDLYCLDVCERLPVVGRCLRAMCDAE